MLAVENEVNRSDPPGSGGSGNETRTVPSPAATLPAHQSKRTGINRHTEHLADLILDITPGSGDGDLPTFQSYKGFVEKLIDGIRKKEFEALNEKFDGSPALLLGFDHEGSPFVAYKFGVGSSRGSRIVRNADDAKELFAADNPLRHIFTDCIRYLKQRIGKFENQDVIFQADLLFTPNNGNKVEVPSGIAIKPNEFGIEYLLAKDSRFYELARDAKVGLVVHSAMSRKFNPENGQVAEGESLEVPGLVQDFVRTLRSKAVFAIDPWKKGVRLETEGADDFTETKEQRIRDDLETMRDRLETLSPEFREKWHKVHDYFKRFMNTSLKEGKSGGLFKAAAEAKRFDFKYLFGKFSEWAEAESQKVVVSKNGKRTKIPKVIPTRITNLSTNHKSELFILFESYFDANRIQYELKPHMEAVYASKLGGGAIEGIMLKDDSTVAKLVDRLEFTRRNFAFEAERRRQARARRRVSTRRTSSNTRVQSTAKSIFAKWQPNAIFVIGKYQPPHSGHIAYIKKVKELAGDRPVYVLASNKVPNVDAEKWNELGVADTKGKLIKRDYERVFSQEFREMCFRKAFGDEMDDILFCSPREFYSYLRRAKDEQEEGHVYIAMGEKERDAGSYSAPLKNYSSHLKSMVIPMQKDEVSGTDVKLATRNLALDGDLGSYQLLSFAFDYFPPKERHAVIHQAVREWTETDAEVQRLVS